MKKHQQKRLATLILLPPLLIQGVAFAISNEKMLNLCEASEWVMDNAPIHIEDVNDPAFQRSVDHSYCSGYMAAVLHSAYSKALVEETCIPEGVTTRQITTIYNQYIKKHPNVWHEDALPTVFLAIRKVFH